jgi:hypothetical protein
MLAVVRLQPNVFEHPGSVDALTDLAAEHELILVYADDAPVCVVRSLRLVLRRHRLLSLMVDSQLLRHEIDLVQNAVADGTIPVLVAMRDTVMTDLCRRVGADADFALLPRPVHRDGRGIS